jgi:hypothetical protein
VGIFLSISLESFNCDSKNFKESAFEFLDVAEYNILSIFKPECISCLSYISVFRYRVYEIHLHLGCPDTFTFITLILKSTGTFKQLFFGLKLRIYMPIEFHCAYPTSQTYLNFDV